MDKKLQGLLGVVGALAAAVPAQAATMKPMTLENALHAGSYADLLQPIPNAVVLRDELSAVQATRPGGAELFAIKGHGDDHHHHHHNNYYPRYVPQYNYHHHHHHHHHHQQQYYRPGLQLGPVIIR